MPDLTQLNERVFSGSFVSLFGGTRVRQKTVRPVPGGNIGNGIVVHERFSSGWEYRGSFLNSRGYWVPGLWVADDESH
ncbi:MAG: hypothetical protein AB8B96_02450 [Lysobacterales bacterium]